MSFQYADSIVNMFNVVNELIVSSNHDIDINGMDEIESVFIEYAGHDLTNSYDIGIIDDFSVYNDFNEDCIKLIDMLRIDTINAGGIINDNVMTMFNAIRVMLDCVDLEMS